MQDLLSVIDIPNGMEDGMIEPSSGLGLGVFAIAGTLSFVPYKCIIQIKILLRVNKMTFVLLCTFSFRVSSHWDDVGSCSRRFEWCPNIYTIFFTIFHTFHTAMSRNGDGEVGSMHIRVFLYPSFNPSSPALRKDHESWFLQMGSIKEQLCHRKRYEPRNLLPDSIPRQSIITQSIGVIRYVADGQTPPKALSAISNPHCLWQLNQNLVNPANELHHISQCLGMDLQTSLCYEKCHPRRHYWYRTRHLYL